MKPRQAVQTSLPAPPVALLIFHDPSRYPRGGPGSDAYPDRDTWLAARRDWEARHALTVGEWSAATLAELQRLAGSLDEANEALRLTMFEPDEDNWDPRVAS